MYSIVLFLHLWVIHVFTLVQLALELPISVLVSVSNEYKSADIFVIISMKRLKNKSADHLLVDCSKGLQHKQVCRHPGLYCSCFVTSLLFLRICFV